MLPAPISASLPNGTITAAQPAPLRLGGLPSRRSPASTRRTAALYTAHPGWSHAPDGTIRRLLPAGAGRAWLATWADGGLDLKPLNGAPGDTYPGIHRAEAGDLPMSAPTSLRIADTVLHVSTPVLWDALSVAIMSQGPCPHAARTLARHWSQQFGEMHLTEGGALYLVPDPTTVLVLLDDQFDTHGVPGWRVPLRAAAAAYHQHASRWRQLDDQSLVRAFTALEGVGALTARAAVADFRANFALSPLPHGLNTSVAITDREHNALALFHLTGRSSTPGCTMTLDARSGSGRQSSGASCLRAASAATDAAVRSRPTVCERTGERLGVHKEHLKVVIVGAEGAGKTTLVRSVSEYAIVDTDVPRSTPSGNDALTAGGATLHASGDTTTTAMDFGRLTLPDGTVLRVFGTPGAPRFSLREHILTGADFAVLLLDLDSAKPAIPLLDLLEERNVPVAVAVRQPSKGPMPAPNSIRSRLRLHDPTSPVLSVDSRDPHSARRMLADATEGLRQQTLRLTVLRLFTNGLSDHEIAVALGEPSAEPVRAHADSICRILGTRSRIHAATLGVVRQLITAYDLPRAPARLPYVSARERELLSLMVLGIADADIAVRLAWSCSDVRTATKHLTKQFNATSDIQLGAHAVLLGAVTCHAVDERLPDVPLAELRAEDVHERGDLR